MTERNYFFEHPPMEAQLQPRAAEADGPRKQLATGSGSRKGLSRGLNALLSHGRAVDLSQTAPAWLVRKNLDLREAEIRDLQKALKLRDAEVAEVKDELRRQKARMDATAAEVLKNLELYDGRMSRAMRAGLEMERDRLARDLSEARAEIEQLQNLVPRTPAPANGIVPETLKELQSEWDAAKQRLSGRHPKKTKFSTKSRDTVARYWDHIEK